MAADYKVDKKQEIQKLVKGEVVTFFRIWATSKGGTYFHVDVSDVELEGTKTSEILSKRAKELDAI